MNKKQNPKLKEGDRIVLIYMPGENLDTGTKGMVKNIGQQPSYGSEFDYMYNVEWYDEDNKVISNLSLLPQSDTWMLDPEFGQKNIKENRFNRFMDLDSLISHVEWSRLFKKADLQYVLDFLLTIKKIGVVNMLESGQFLGQTKEYMTKYFDLHRMQRDLDEDTEELIEKVIDMTENVRNILISASITDIERKNKEITTQSVTSRLNRLQKEVLKSYVESF